MRLGKPTSIFSDLADSSHRQTSLSRDKLLRTIIKTTGSRNRQYVLR